MAGRVGANQREPSRSNTKPRILVVDDERMITRTLAVILQREGYETATAYSGEEAIRVACSFHPDSS